MNLFKRLRLAILLSGCAWLAGVSPAAEPDALVWRAGPGKVDARIEGWGLDKVLQRISAATGWRIYVEPDTGRSISVKFKNLDVPEALRALLSGLNFALLPQTNAPAKLFVYRTSVQDAIQLVKPAASGRKTAGQPIPNQLIVTLKPDAKENIEALARRLGAKVIGRIDGLNTYELQFADEAATQSARDALGQDSSVAGFDNNFSFSRPDSAQPLSLSSSAPLALKPNVKNDANRVVVGLIDTGVQAQGARLDNYVLPAISVAGQSDLPATQPTHGTSMAETILRGVAQTDAGADGTSVRILPVDVYGNNADTSTFDVAKGIYSAIQNGATLINLSLGGTGDSEVLHQLIQSASSQGILFFGAAGNVPNTDPTYPAAYPEVISVTAGSKTGLAPYANRGDFVDVVAPGASIITFNGQDYLVTGTSAATADVTGLAAGLSDHSGKTPAQVRAEILNKLSIAPFRKP
ncbi:MAG: S8 family serine peptidase [Limisphaerales bacterium]